MWKIQIQIYSLDNDLSVYFTTVNSQNAFFQSKGGRGGPEIIICLNNCTKWRNIQEISPVSLILRTQMRTQMLTIGTYKHNLQVVALEGFEQIGDSSLQSSIDEDTITEMVQQNGSQSVQITCQWQHKANVIYILCRRGSIFFSPYYWTM